MQNNKMKRGLLAGLVLSAISGCNIQEQDKPVVTIEPQTLEATEMKQGVGLPLQILPQNTTVETIKFFEKNTEVMKNARDQYLFSHGLVHADLSDNTVLYVPTSTAQNRTISYELTTADQIIRGSLTIRGDLKSDPLFSEQWHLKNTGQTGYAMQAQTYQAWIDLRTAQGMSEEEVRRRYQYDPSILVSGEDMNVLAAYQQNITGQQVTTVVVDSGMAIAHEDLVDNVLPNRSINFVDGTNDPTATGTGGDHGTSVAGLIAAKGWNGLGGRGVAPDANLIGMNYLEEQSSASQAASYGMTGSGISESENIAAFNRSYGISAPAFIPTETMDETMYRYPTQYLRQGLGALNIKSAGNAFESTQGWAEGNQLCNDAQNGIVSGRSRVLSCYDSNWDPSNASFYTVTVGATTTAGKKSSYSTAGSSLWVAAPGGEYGTTEPAMVTTDQMSCQRGYASQAAVDEFEQSNGAFLAALGVEDFHARVWPFNTPGTDLNRDVNPSCNYTNTFNGTSSAAPNVTGVVALLAQANPQLTWRQIRYILAATADKIDADDQPISLLVGGEDSQRTVPVHLGWVDNAAGFSFNNKYGFGRVNAGKAIEMATQNLIKLLPLVESEWIDVSPSVPLSIPDADTKGASLRFTLDESLLEKNLTIEGLQFGFNIENADLTAVSNGDLTGSTAASDIAIKVTSPSGTEAILATSRTSLGAYQGLGNSGHPGYAYHISGPMLANAFLGEAVYGQWTVDIVDTNRADFGDIYNNRVPSQLTAAQIRVYGH